MQNNTNLKRQLTLEREKKEKVSIPLVLLIFFTFIVYIAPQIYFPALIPLHLAKLSVILAMLIHVQNALRNRQPVIKMDTELLLGLILFFLAVLSIPFSSWPGGSFGMLKETYIKVVIVYFLLVHTLTTLYRVKLMAFFIVLFCIFDAIVGINHYLTGQYHGGGGIYDRIQGAAAGIVSNPNDLALTLVLAMPFALYLFMISRKPLHKLVCGIYVLLAMVAVMSTFSRGGFVTLAVVLAVFALKMLKQKGPKIILLFILILMVFVIMAPSEYTGRLSSITDFSKDDTGSANARMASTRAGISIMFESPIFGTGLGMNGLSLNDKNLGWTLIHNAYLQIGADLGVPAFIVFVLLLFKLIKNVRLIQKNTAGVKEEKDLLYMAQAVEVSLIGFAVGALVAPVAYNFYFYYLAGFAIALNRISSSSKNADTERRDTASHGANTFVGIKK